MNKPVYLNKTPKWAQDEAEDPSVLDDTPLIGIEPPYAPRLPTRLVPPDNMHSISGLTLKDTVEITQKILTYAAQEAAFGVQFEFSDLRSVNADVANLARLWIEPFETGSFVIPARLEERSIKVNTPSGDITLSSRQILNRFVLAMEGIPAIPEFSASIGLVNSVEDLGRILKREATAIEYLPVGYSNTTNQTRSIFVDAEFVSRVSDNRKRRLDMSYTPDALQGRLLAVDISAATLKLRLDDGSEIRGTFERTAAENIVSSLGERVSLQGVVARKNKRPTSIRAFICEIRDF